MRYPADNMAVEKDATEPTEQQPERQLHEDNSQEGGGGGGSGGGSGGWRGWGFSSFSVLSDLQKAAEEISRNAVEVAKTAAKSITDVPFTDDSNSESASADDADASENKHHAATATATAELKEEAKDNDRVEESKRDILLRNSALDRLEKASQDSLLGQGLKVIDDSVESFASGAWLALGSALKGGSTLIHRLEHSAVNLADSIQHGALPVNTSSFAPSILETGKSFTAKGIQVLERVGKETMDLLISETGLEVENDNDKFDHHADDEHAEEINFDRCFYIYGGPEQLEELEALSNHYGLLLSRKKAKLLSEQKSFYDGKLKQIQQVLNLSSEIEENEVDLDKGKHIEMENDASCTEMKILHDSSVSKAADIAAGFVTALGGLSMHDVFQRTAGRLETVHAEGVHRLSELCSVAVSHLLMLGKSVISNINKSRNEEEADNIYKVDWPEDSVSKAKIIRSKAKLMSRDIESVANSFVTGVSEIIEAYQEVVQSISSDTDDVHQKKSVQEKAGIISKNFIADQAKAQGKIQEALQYLGHVVLSTSMPTA